MKAKVCDLINEFNHTNKVFGDQIAVIDKENEITYEELYIQVSKLTERITCEKQPIGIVARRSIQTVIQILAVLQSGNYYIPIDPNLPEERIDYIINKTNTRLVFDGDQLNWLHQTKVTVPFAEKLNANDKIAYIIFTCGSTGLPKGVVETHEQVMNTLYDLQERMNLNEKDHFLCLASFNFDLSVFDVFGSILVGGKLSIVEDQRDSVEIKKILEERNITVLNSVPSVLNYFLKEIEISKSARERLRVCLLSGDYVSVDLAKTTLETFPKCQTYSLGGATECSIWSILHLITKENIINTPYIPYGNPMSNQRIYILNQEFIPEINGTIGQIAIAGSSVALGYIGDESKTNETFIEHKQLGYLYLTGDLGQFCGDHIKFTGRMDSRLKVNGYRVSLSEISAVFHQHFGFENRVFLLEEQEGTQKLALAYQNKEAVKSTIIRKELLQHLAAYEIPHVQFNFSSFPLTQNGKIDMKALKKAIMEKLHEKSSEQHRVEESANISLFRQMLAEVLQTNHLSANDSLFDLGVDSLQLVKIKNWIEEHFKVDMEIIDIYDCDHVEALENYIEEMKTVK